MLTVAQCVHGLGLGGAQEVIRLIAGEGPERGIRSVVYSPEGGALELAIAATGSEVRIVPRSLPILDPSWVFALARRFRADGIRLVHGHLFGDSLHGYLAARLAGQHGPSKRPLPVVLTLHTTYETLPWSQRLGYAWLLPRVAGRVACSVAVKESFERAFPTLAGKIHTVVNGVEAEPLRGKATLRGLLGLNAEIPVILAVGRLVEEKGFDILIDAVAELQRAGGPPVHLALVGDGPLRGALETRARERGVSEAVTFLGVQRNIPELLAGGDVVAFSSINEGLPMALLEAMAAGRPIVATDLAGFREALESDRDALLVPVRQARPLAAALRRVLAEPQLAQSLGSAAAERFRSAFRADRMVQAYAELYRHLMSPATT
jgi:glycosyltransferase involved in cell wall biosynthesis